MDEEQIVVPYSEKVTQIRSMPQETDLQREEKELSAKVLRLENYLNYSDVIATAKYELIENPDLSAEELAGVFEKKKSEFSKPELVDTVIEKMRVNAKLTSEALDEYRKSCDLPLDKNSHEPNRWPEEESGKVGASIFESLTGKTPYDEVTVTFTALGVTLLIKDDEDIKSLRGDDNISSGFFRDRVSADVNGKTISYPLIMVKNQFGHFGSLKHELGHVVGHAVMDTLNEQRKARIKNPEEHSEIEVMSLCHENASKVGVMSGGVNYKIIDGQSQKDWVLVDLATADNPEEFRLGWVKKDMVIMDEAEYKKRWGGKKEKVVEISDIKSEAALFRSLVKNAYPMLTSVAKDEMLADYQSTEDFRFSSEITRRGNSYDMAKKFVDTLREHKKIFIDDEAVERVMAEFWKRYKANIEKFEKTANVLNNWYKEKQFFARKRLLPHVLAQVPMTNWQGNERRNFLGAFFEEINYYDEVRKKAQDMYSAHAGNTQYQEVLNKINGIRAYVDENPTKSILPILAECSKSLEDLK